MFADRNDAGARLARALPGPLPDPLVLGIPRGGVVVARVVADALDAPLDVIVVRKIGAPGNAELAIGAIGPDGRVALDHRVIDALDGVPTAYIEAEAERQRAEIARREHAYRGERPPLDVTRRCVVLVDDGIATGATARAALLWLREHGAARVILAVPVAPPRTARELAEGAEVVAVITPETYHAVGQWYDRFDQVEDEAVIDLLSPGPAGGPLASTLFGG
jgi:predicted phosphoribosyltransferase